MSVRRAVVTGANGFVGRHLIGELINSGYEVYAIVRKKKQNKLCEEQFQKCHIIEKKIEDLTDKDFENKPYDVFFHMAWDCVTSKEKNNLDRQLNNISMSIRALEIAHTIGCEKFICSGTVAEYTQNKGIMDFSLKHTPSDYYGATKVAAYYFLNVRARQLGQNFIWTILPSIYGEGRRNDNIITYTIVSLLNGKRPSYGDLNKPWEFLYVGEVVRCLRLIGEFGSSGSVYGVSGGEYKTLKYYVVMIKEIMGSKVELGIGDINTMDTSVISSCPPFEKTRNDTGYIPNTTFEDNIKKTIEWYSENEVNL